METGEILEYSGSKVNNFTIDAGGCLYFDSARNSNEYYN